MIAALDIDPYSDELLADPRAFHAELRDAGPVVWLGSREPGMDITRVRLLLDAAGRMDPPAGTRDPQPVPAGRPGGRLARRGVHARSARAGGLRHADLRGRGCRRDPRAGRRAHGERVPDRRHRHHGLHDRPTTPDQWRALHDDPTLARTAFEETVRYDTPADPLFRTTARPTEVGGVALEEGRKVLIPLAAANRDPRRYDEPDRFDLRRSPGGHVGFGRGVHSCVGQTFARMEGEAVLLRVTPRRGNGGSR